MDITIPFFGVKVRLEILILVGLLSFILLGHAMAGCSRVGLMEGFALKHGTMAQTKSKADKEGFAGLSSQFSDAPAELASERVIDTATWSSPNMGVVAGQPVNQAVSEFLAREQQPVPLPQGEMLMFATTPFKPECCPNAYSNSSGCACMTGEQYNYLQLRGSNNVPYSEF